MNLKEGSPCVDHWDFMNDDYTIPDVSGQTMMSPEKRSHLPSEQGTLQMSVEHAVRGVCKLECPHPRLWSVSGFLGIDHLCLWLDHFKAN